MPVFRRFVEDVLPLVPTILRRREPVVIDADGTTTSSSVVNLIVAGLCQALDAETAALDEYITESWPLETASGWVLDQHWGPYHNLQRNGMDDATFRLFNRAKRRLNASWGSGEQAIEIFRLLLPTATVKWIPHYPKAWEVIITGVDMATAAPAVAFMEKKPSPIGGGFSVAGDNGWATISDLEVLSYSSVHGAVQVTGFYGSIYGAGGGAQAGHAHAAFI